MKYWTNRMETPVSYPLLFQIDIINVDWSLIVLQSDYPIPGYCESERLEIIHLSGMSEYETITTHMEF